MGRYGDATDFRVGIAFASFDDGTSRKRALRGVSPDRMAYSNDVYMWDNVSIIA